MKGGATRTANSGLRALAASWPGVAEVRLWALALLAALALAMAALLGAAAHAGAHHGRVHAAVLTAAAAAPAVASPVAPPPAAAVPVTHVAAEAVDAVHVGPLILFTVLYTGLGLLLFIGGGMYAALRDRQYLYYLGYVAATLAYLMARNGHLSELPGPGWFDALGILAAFALGNVLAAAMIVTARGFADLGRVAPGLDRVLKWAPLAPAALALVCLANLQSLRGLLETATVIVRVAAIVLAVAATAMAWRGRQRMALPMLLMWLTVLAACGLRAMLDASAVPGDGWLPYVDQVAYALNALMLGMALTDHIIEFRLQRDRASLAKEQADASLKRERERLRFIEALHTTLRDAPSGDQEWLGFRRLLEVIRELVPQASSAVALHGFHDADLLLCEPNTSKEAYQHLLATRSGAFKGITRSQLPMQLRVDAPAPAEGGEPELLQVAVVPLPLTAPAWGMLLIERRGWQGFERDELNLASELAHKAARAVEDAANDRVLRINAEFDALTAVFNRRTMDNRLAAYFKESLVRRSALAVLFSDLDHLQETNEVYGHAAGDQSLRLLADALKAHCGTAGVVGRYAADKFVVILPDFNPEQARRWAETMRIDAMGRDLQLADGKVLRVSVSVGIASRLAEDTDVNQILERVSKALLASKRSGRGAVQAPPIQGVASRPLAQ